MHRAGGVCIQAGPVDGALPKVSARIRALQDRLMDSLPSEGGWECLSPAQREAILSLHRCRAISTDDSSEHGDAAPRRPHRGHGVVSRLGRSRSYDDRLESETDDSGVRGSSGATSHNSLEDDSSDHGLKRGQGRFTKAVTADRTAHRGHPAEPHQPTAPSRTRRPEVTNGFGNVNKMISKQINKNPASSNITLDCRNVHGEKRRRSRVDADAFKENGGPRGLEAIRETAPPRRSDPVEVYPADTKIMHSSKEVATSEDYDSGVNLRHDDSLEDFVKQVIACDLAGERPSHKDTTTTSTSPTLHTNRRECSTDRLAATENLTPRKASAERNPFGGGLDRQHVRPDQARTKTRDRTKAGKTGEQPLKSNLKVGYGAKLNSTFDYRTSLNQEVNRYTSNWNNFILSHDVPIRPAAPAGAPRESRFTKHGGGGGGGGGGVARSTGNLVAKSAVHARRDPVNWAGNDPRRTPNPSMDRNSAKKYIRSKSLDRRYLDEDSSDEESDFETRRRTDRVRRYQRANPEREMGMGRTDERGGYRQGPVKAKSAWDLTGPTRPNRDDFDDFEQIGFRNRSDFRNRWESEEGPGRRRKSSNDSEFSRSQWNRRSCDFEVEISGHDIDQVEAKVEFDRKRWYRRSCDLDLDFELHHGRPESEEPWPQHPRLAQPEVQFPAHLQQEQQEVIPDGRRTRLEDYYRSKTSLDHRSDKRERSRTPHLLRGKLRLLRAFLSF